MKRLTVTAFFLISFASSYSQNKTMGVGTPTPNANAALHVESPTANQGFIMPRLTTAQRTAMAGLLTTPDQGLMLYDTDLKTIYIWDGAAWKSTAQVAGGARLGYPYKDSVASGTGTPDLFALKYNNAENKRVVRIENLHPTNGSSSLSVLQAGTGLAGFFQVNNGAAGSTAVYGTTNSDLGGALAPVGIYGESTGTGSLGGAFWNTNAANTFPALYARTQGTGSAASFEIVNAANTSAALFVNTNGSGNAIQTPGRIQAGQFIGDGSGITNLPPVSFPFNVSLSNAGALFGVTNTGNGRAAEFIGNNSSTGETLYTEATGTAHALRAVSSGTVGGAARFNSTNATNTTTTIIGTSGGLGTVASFSIQNASSGAPAAFVSTVGTGNGITSEISNAANAGYALSGETNGANLSAGVYGHNTGNGFGVLARAENGTLFGSAAVYGEQLGTGDASGAFRINNASNSYAAVYGETNGTGPAVSAVQMGNTTGSAGYFQVGDVTNNLGTGAAVFGAQNGLGRAGTFQITNTANADAAIRGFTNGTGRSGFFTISNPSNTSAGIFSTTNGLGNAIHGVNIGTGNGSAAFFEISEVTNAAPAMNVNTAGVGAAANFNISEPTNNISTINANTSGTGGAGYFSINNASSSAAGLHATTIGTGAALQGQTSTGFAAVYGRREGSTGGHAGSFETTDPGNNFPSLKARTQGAGPAGHFETDNATNPAPSLFVTSNGTGQAGSFEITSLTNTSAALLARHNGNSGGTALYAEHLGSAPGFAAIVRNGHASNSFPALVAETIGTGRGGEFKIINSGSSSQAIFATTNGTGHGVYSETTSASNNSAAFYGTSNAAASFAANFRNTNTSNTGGALYLVNYGTGSTAVINHRGSSGDLLEMQDNDSKVARIDKTGQGFFNGGTQTGGADIAELFDVEGTKADYEPGDVLVISESTDRTVEKSTSANSRKVAGVYATKPGVTLTEKGIDESIDTLVPMGVIGVIPTKVCLEGGPIKRGDLLVTSSQPGRAMKATPTLVNGLEIYPQGAILGKALENFDGNTNGIIKVLVNVK